MMIGVSQTKERGGRNIFHFFDDDDVRKLIGPREFIEGNDVYSFPF